MRGADLLVLHAFWSITDGPGLWAEDSDKPINSTSQAVKRARPHPFAADVSVLSKLLPMGEGGSIELRLPSIKRAPLDSPRLVRVDPRRASKTSPELLGWQVPVIWLSPSGLNELVAQENPEQFAARNAAAMDVRLSDSTEYLLELAVFACELAGQARVLPKVSWTAG